MGKLSRKKTFDGKPAVSDDKQQRKISSFFENKSANTQTSSKLFTSITDSKKSSLGSNRNECDKPFASKRSVGLKTVPQSSNSSRSYIDNDDVICVDDDCDSGKDTRKCSSVNDRDLSVVVEDKDEASQQSSVNYINKEVLGNQENISLPSKPDGKSQRSHTDVVKKVKDSPGDIRNVSPSKSTQKMKAAVSPDMICNTPGIERCGGMRFKNKHDGRSFLRPYHLLTKQPDLKSAEMRLNAKRKICKTAGPVSISFNSSDASALDNQKVVTATECGGEDLRESGDGLQPTPTKNYQSDLVDLVKVKRMAKPGLSPDSKRATGQSIATTDKVCASPVIDTDVEKVKRNLNLDSASSVKRMDVSAVVENLEPPVGQVSVDKESANDFPYSSEDNILADDVSDFGMSNLEKDFNVDLYGFGFNSCSLKKNNKNSVSSVQQQQPKSSKKFTVKDAEALGWKGVAKSETKNVNVTLKDDHILDELMQGLVSSSPVTGRPSKPPKNFQKRKSTKTSGSSKTKGEDDRINLSSLVLKSDEVLRSFGMDLPEEVESDGQNQTSSANLSSTTQSVSEKSLSSSKIPSNSATKIAETDCYLDDSDLDFAMLAALEDGTNQESGPKQTESEKLASSFGALSPFKVPKEKTAKDETSTFASSKLEFRFSDLWQRFKVKHVEYDSHADVKHLTLCKESDSATSSFHCTLRGFWVDTKVSEEDIVNLIGRFDDDNRCTIDDKSGIMVVSPDLLLSGTSVVSSVFCPRKSVLNEKFKGLDQGNAHMLYGSIIHSLFQTVLKDNLRRQGEIMQVARTLLAAPKFLHAMYSLGVTEATVMEEIKQYIPPLMTWLDNHMAPSDDPGLFSSNCKKSSVVVTDIQDIEENIWSPRFGLKGKIDLTVKAKLQDKNGLVETKTVPLELKTGKASFSSEHKGQVTLYCMMYGDRRGDPGEGLLLYLKTGQMETVQVKPQSMSGLIQLRNQLASFFKDQVSERLDDKGDKTLTLGRLPDPINNQRACEKCAHLLNCCLYQRSVESIAKPPSPPLPHSHPMTRLVPESLGHLDPPDLDYFVHWVTCLQMEEQEASQRHLGPIWNMGSKERERKGDCLSHLSIQSSELGIQESQGFNEGKGCSLTFVRHHGYQDSPSLDCVGLIVNDAVVVSSEDGRLIALATGFIRTISAKHVEVIVDRDNLYDISVYKNILFRLDRNTSFSTSAQLMANLTRLMENSSHASKLRELIIRKRQPHSVLKIPMAWVRTMKPVFKGLNKPQKTAILKVLMSTDYTLIRGFPGTGKTSIIVALVKVLQLLGQSVLLTSYTHSAVDNILLRLKRDDVPFLRLGRQARVHPTIRPHSAEILTSSIPSVDELKKFYNSYSVVATSCLGVSHNLFDHRRFDVCIVDEASQVLQPACLGPLFHCQKFVLVGDSQQLAPVVQSKGARSIGMDESLFSRLEDGGATYDLYLQYRMNKVIMAVSNSLVYNGRLECGSQDVASQCLSLELSKVEDCPDWIKTTLSPDLSRSVVFLDTDKFPNQSSGQGHSGTQNELEATIVISLLKILCKASASTRDLGVISPYRSQVKLLQRKVECCPLITGVEVNTVDQYQGRDKSVIVVSFAMTDNGVGDLAGELLKDIRRLNVAVTRARHKLILVGNARTLKAWSHLEGIMTHLQASQCVLQVPLDSFPS